MTRCPVVVPCRDWFRGDSDLLVCSTFARSFGYEATFAGWWGACPVFELVCLSRAEASSVMPVNGSTGHLTFMDESVQGPLVAGRGDALERGRSGFPARVNPGSVCVMALLVAKPSMLDEYLREVV